MAALNTDKRFTVGHGFIISLLTPVDARTFRRKHGQVTIVLIDGQCAFIEHRIEFNVLIPIRNAEC